MCMPVPVLRQFLRSSNYNAAISISMAVCLFFNRLSFVCVIGCFFII